MAGNRNIPGADAKAAPGLRALSTCMAVGLALFWPGGAGAQDWPKRPLNLIVSYPAGGPTDRSARIIAAGLAEALGAQVNVENVGGAGGIIGVTKAARAAPDGHNLSLGGLGGLVTGSLLHDPRPFDPVKDFEAIGLIGRQPLVIIARKDLPAANLQEFIAYAKARPGMTFGGGGGLSTFACILLGTEAKIDLTNVGYRGTPPAMIDLQGGRIDSMCDFVSTAAPFIQSGAVKPIAVLSRARSRQLPNLPTVHEQGVPNFGIDSWIGLFVPKGTPDALVQRLNAALARALDSPTVVGEYEKIGFTVVPPEQRSSAILSNLVKSEIVRWEGPIKTSMKDAK